MANIMQLIAQLRDQAKLQGLSKTALACRAGLAPNTLKKFWEDDWNPSADTLVKLETALITGSVTLDPVASGGLLGKKILLIITGGIAAYKSLDLIRRLQDAGAVVTGVLTKGGAEFITPLSVASLSGNQCYTDLFDLKEESEMGHIRLSRDNDLILVAPATADIMAKMAQGVANDLATTLLLATDKPVMVAPAMNSQMWAHPATERNITTLSEDGIQFVDPAAGLLACGEVGPGKLADVMDIATAVKDFFTPKAQPLKGKHVLITAGPTHEPIDPVRYIANRSSGKQGFAIAEAFASAGAKVTLIAGPVNLPTPEGLAQTGKRLDVESARQMHHAVHENLPADVAIFVAAVADWRTSGSAEQKMKKEGKGLPDLKLAENPDILASVAQLSEGRPELVIGFAAETEKVIEHATSKRIRKACDWIIANDVSAAGGAMGGDSNSVHIISEDGCDTLPEASKEEVGRMIVDRVVKSTIR